jgi:hypothetical protein
VSKKSPWYIVTCRAEYRRVLEWIIGFIAPYAFTTRDYRQYSAISILHTFQFTVTHALGFSVFTSRLLATGLSQSHCHFKSHVKSSCHSLIFFLPLFYSCQFRILDSIQFLCYRQAGVPKLYSSHDYCSLFKRLSLSVYNPSARTSRKTTPSVVNEACLLVR